MIGPFWPEWRRIGEVLPSPDAPNPPNPQDVIEAALKQEILGRIRETRDELLERIDNLLEQMTVAELMLTENMLHIARQRIPKPE
jgi:hypothetical protein